MIINGFASKAAALRHLRAAGHNFTSLLTSPEANPKVAKNGKLGVLSAPLHLAPFDLSGFQVCPQASAGCAAACLHTAGNPAYMSGKDASRKDKTRAYFKQRDAFLALLTFEIAALVTKAHKLNMGAAIRLNATSDLPWEHRTVILDGVKIGLMDAFPTVQFYDYTKVTKRAIAHAEGRMPSNYHLTFSKTEDNDKAVATVLEAGGNVAAVFAPDALKVTLASGVFHGLGFIPSQGHKVIDGDETDYRPMDPAGVIVALKAKGDARSDTSGFTIR
jgi:hypothetical protein